ncbi:uncharacterized protein TNCV_2069411 [Trichonephila clavipes]|uniref:Uncharacterized protein n=1 Tax=Trichonephila clavipes TaxID=2585209 RepID=A0A8X6W3R7_TRICX|nr:uncharacterized protein TNCV_2069411 [Trichonephila clavipes]
MSSNTLQVHKKYVLVKSVGPKGLWAVSRVQETGENIPPLQFHGKIVEVEIGGVAIYRPFGEFLGDNSYCLLYGAQSLGQRQAWGLDLCSVPGPQEVLRDVPDAKAIGERPRNFGPRSSDVGDI